MPARLALAACLFAAFPAVAQVAPRPLFPTEPQPPPATVAPDVPIGVQDLPAPAARTAGLADAEVELAGPLWANGAPPGLATLLRRLPTAIDEPALRELQRALLAAPGPADVGSDGLLGVRAARLLAMGEAATALELLAAAPPSAGPELEALRLRAGFAAGKTEPACASAEAAAGQGSSWLEAAVVCAVLARDVTAVELGLDRLASEDIASAPNLAGLARAAAAGMRYTLRPPVADDALLLPLLRVVPVDLDSATAADLPVAVRRALADNPGLSSATRAAVLLPSGPGPSIRPELTGAEPADWAAAAASVPVDQRARWAALVDGLGLALPDAVWDELAAAPVPDPGPPPELALWCGFELASLREQRGGVLLFTLLLLDGRPAAAAPVTLRRALDALIALGLEWDARALAAGAGGALGL
jgi:hypothetical protein